MQSLAISLSFNNVIILYICSVISWQTKLGVSWFCHHHHYHDLFLKIVCSVVFQICWIGALLRIVPALWDTFTSSSVLGIGMHSSFNWYLFHTFIKDMTSEASFEVCRNSNNRNIFVCLLVHTCQFFPTHAPLNIRIRPAILTYFFFQSILTHPPPLPSIRPCRCYKRMTPKLKDVEIIQLFQWRIEDHLQRKLVNSNSPFWCTYGQFEQ